MWKKKWVTLYPMSSEKYWKIYWCRTYSSKIFARVHPTPAICTSDTDMFCNLQKTESKRWDNAHIWYRSNLNTNINYISFRSSPYTSQDFGCKVTYPENTTFCAYVRHRVFLKNFSNTKHGTTTIIYVAIVQVGLHIMHK